MFCKKCGEVIEDGEELCQACRQRDSSMRTTMEGELNKTRTKMRKIFQDTLDESMEEIRKAFQKKTKQAVRKTMVKVGLKKKTPLDKAKDMWKKIKK